MKKNLNKKENKVWKYIRNIISMGFGGAMVYLFPNFIITQLSFLVGILVGKGILSFGAGFAITTFLGSQAGLLLQKALLGLISYIASNLTLKLGGKLVKKINNKKKKNYNSNNIDIQIQSLNNTQNNDYTQHHEINYQHSNNNTINQKKLVKKLGTHPSYKK